VSDRPTGPTPGQHQPPRRPAGPVRPGRGGGQRIGSLCTGYGGLDLAVEWVLGGRLAWYAETDPHARTVCEHHWPGIANLGDIRDIDWSGVEPVEILTAGFPCQDISNAGKRAGITGEHSSVWTAVTDAVRTLRPPLVFVENVAALLHRGFDTVQADLAANGYDTRWLCLRASDVGAAHRRDRLFLLAADRRRLRAGADPADADPADADPADAVRP
jgi:DNA (cytosine-5)-methyltransferase 1